MQRNAGYIERHKACLDDGRIWIHASDLDACDKSHLLINQTCLCGIRTGKIMGLTQTLHLHQRHCSPDIPIVSFAASLCRQVDENMEPLNLDRFTPFPTNKNTVHINGLAQEQIP